MRHPAGNAREESVFARGLLRFDFRAVRFKLRVGKNRGKRFGFFGRDPVGSRRQTSATSRGARQRVWQNERPSAARLARFLLAACRGAMAPPASGKSDQRLQRIVKLVGVANIRPSLLAHFGDGRGIEPADFREHGFGQHAAHLDGAGAAFFERRVVQIGVGIRVQDLVRKLRRHGRIDGEASDLSCGDIVQDDFQALDIHRFGERVLHRFAHQRMIGNLDLAVNIFLARERLAGTRRPADRPNACAEFAAELSCRP